MSDVHHWIIKVYEIIATLVAGCSQVTSDDCRLKCSQMSVRTCNMYGIKDEKHLVMQCPDTQGFRGSLRGIIFGAIHCMSEICDEKAYG